MREGICNAGDDAEQLQDPAVGTGGQSEPLHRCLKKLRGVILQFAISFQVPLLHLLSCVYLPGCCP